MQKYEEGIILVKLIVYPLLGCFLGLLTNLIAIILLFHPRKKILGIQGVLEKRRSVIARKLSSALCIYFLDAESLSELITREKIHGIFELLLVETTRKLPSFMVPILSGVMEHAVYNMFFENGTVKQKLLEKIVSSKELEELIYQKIMAYDMRELEKIILQVTGSEISFLVFSGGALGILVGLVEAFLPL